MSEMSNTQMQHSAENVEQVEQETLVALALAGFTPAETARLLAARNRTQQGDLERVDRGLQAPAVRALAL